MLMIKPLTLIQCVFVSTFHIKKNDYLLNFEKHYWQCTMLYNLHGPSIQHAVQFGSYNGMG